MQLKKLCLSLGCVGYCFVGAALLPSYAYAADNSAETTAEQKSSEDALSQAFSNFKNSAQSLAGELHNSSKQSLEEVRQNAEAVWKETEKSLNSTLENAGQKLNESTASTLNYLAQTTNELAKSLQSKSGAEKTAILNLDATLQQMYAMSANFNQEVYDATGEVLARSSGDIALQRPSKFVMNTLEPDKLVLYTKDGDIYYFDDAVRQVSIYSMNKLKHNPFLLLLERGTDVWDEFTVTQDDERYTLIPKSSQDIRSLTLSFAPYTLKDSQGRACRVLESITIRMTDGNTNFYHFSSQKVDVMPIRFDIVLPSDVEYNDERN